jgi:hypothetical protein
MSAVCMTGWETFATSPEMTENPRMRIDHLVWYSPSLPDGEQHFASRLDRAPAYGGVHPGGATQNSLVSLGEATYVEILARDPAQPATSLDSELAGLKGQGLYHWAIGGVDLKAIVERARRASYAASEVVGGGRKLPDGGWLGWDCVGLHDHAFGALIPFFIDWSGSAHPAASAPRGGRLGKIELYSPEAEKLNALFAALELDLTVTARPQPGIAVTIESRRGPLIMNAFNLVPRGFII